MTIKFLKVWVRKSTKEQQIEVAQCPSQHTLLIVKIKPKEKYCDKY